MSEIHKIEKNGVTIYPATTTDAVVDAETKKTVKELILELEGKVLLLQGRGTAGNPGGVTEPGQYFYHTGQKTIWRVTELNGGSVVSYVAISISESSLYQFKGIEGLYKYNFSSGDFEKFIYSVQDVEEVKENLDGKITEVDTRTNKRIDYIDEGLKEILFLQNNPYKELYAFKTGVPNYRTQYCGYKYNGFICKGLNIKSTNPGETIDIYVGKDNAFELVKSHEFATTNEYEEVIFDTPIELIDKYIGVKGAIRFDTATEQLQEVPLINTATWFIIDYWFIYENKTNLPKIQEDIETLKEEIKNIETNGLFKVLDINGNGDYTSLEEAINNGAEFETIYVKKGEYLATRASNGRGLNFNKGQSFIGESLDNCIFYIEDGEYSSAPFVSNGYFERITFESRHKDGNISRRCYAVHIDGIKRYEGIPFEINFFHCVFRSWNHDCVGCGAAKDLVVRIDNCRLYQMGNDGDIEDSGLYTNPSCIGWHNVANVEANGEYDGAGYLKIKDSILLSKTKSALRFGSSKMQTPEVEWKSEYELINNTIYSETDGSNCITSGSGYNSDGIISSVPDTFRLSKMSHGNNVEFLNA